MNYESNSLDYTRYTEENCMTFKTFARKFKRKANEWINNNNEVTMWEHEHIRKQKSLDLITGLEGLQDFVDLESFTEKELLELLKTLENDIMEISQFTRDIKHVSGVTNVFADYLSRIEENKILRPLVSTVEKWSARSKQDF